MFEAEIFYHTEMNSNSEKQYIYINKIIIGGINPLRIVLTSMHVYIYIYIYIYILILLTIIDYYRIIVFGKCYSILHVIFIEHINLII